MSEKILQSRIRITSALLAEYKLDEPLSAFLKRHFLQNKKYGSKDRKAIADLMYNYFRLGNFAHGEATEKRILIARYLFQLDDKQYDEFLSSQLGIDAFPDGFSQRLQIAENQFASTQSDLFPLLELASDKIDKNKFIEKLAVKPEVWIRIRKDINSVRQNLTKDGFILQDNELLPNAFSVQNPKNLELSGMYQKGNFEIQDLSSQLCSSLIDTGDNANVWDACAGSGGKSLFLADRYPDLSIHCTDIRVSIIQNLKARVKRACRENIDASILDVTDETQLKSWPDGWKHTIADVPCSGSGTWGRTPEQMMNCTKEKIEDFSKLQKNILRNIASKTAKGGFIYYLTCSLFKAENEEVTDHAVHNLNLRKIIEDTICGYEHQADTMYFCKLQKL